MTLNYKKPFEFLNSLPAVKKKKKKAINTPNKKVVTWCLFILTISFLNIYIKDHIYLKNTEGHWMYSKYDTYLDYMINLSSRD